MSVELAMRLFVCLFITITTDVVVRGQTPGPNAIALTNGQTILDCNTFDLSLSNWRQSPDGTNDFMTIASGCIVTGNNEAYYRTEVIGGNICRLIIANATMQQAGVYNCYDGGSSVYRCLVTVIDPVASVVVYNRTGVVDGDQLNISCSIDYTGPASPAPSMRPSPYWTTSPGQIYTNTTYHTSTNVVAVVATVNVQKPTVPIFHCRTVFEITGNTNGYNPIPPPDNLTVGSTAELDVQYAPSTPVITGRPEIITSGGVLCSISVLTCSSTGNPAPNYRWFDSSENVVLTTTSTLTLAEVNRNYKCEVYNIIRNVVHNVLANYTVSEGNCASTVQCCVFPHNETTSVTVQGCNNGTLCDCSHGNSGMRLICNASTFPNASYKWTGPNGQVTYSQIYDKVTQNGLYRCMAYFNEALSNYTGDVTFPNGTNDATVSQCSSPERQETISEPQIP